MSRKKDTKKELKLNKLLILFTLFILIELLGCGGSKTIWQHKTKNNQDFYRDKLECEQIASQMAYQKYPTRQPSTNVNVYNTNNSDGSMMGNLIAADQQQKQRDKQNWESISNSLNSINRSNYMERVVHECMYSKGWYEMRRR